MATDVGTVESGAAVPAPQPGPPETGARPHRARFLLLYATLAAVLGAAIAGIVIFASQTIHPGAKWSTWKPSGGGLGAAKQIASHVAQGYHLPNGQQLVDVIAKPLSVSPSNQQIPLHYVVVRGTKGSGDNIIPVSSSDSVQFTVCGLGQSCSISSGTPSVARGTLVRREILELALYTFKYAGGIKNVIAFMPPPAGSTPQYAIYLQKQDLANELKQPLDRTLSSKVPLPETITRREQQTIDATTESRVYKFSFSQAQTGDAILVLSPLTA